EIQRADLAEVVLLLHSLHIRKAAQFDWLDKPDPAAIDRAEKLLRLLGALESSELSVPSSELAEMPAARQTRNLELETRNSDLTAVGRQMLRLPMHPRYSRMLVEAAKNGCVPSAALCAALVSG